MSFAIRDYSKSEDPIAAMFADREASRRVSKSVGDASHTDLDKKGIEFMRLKYTPTFECCMETFQTALVGLVQTDGFNELGIMLLYSDHKGLDAFKSHFVSTYIPDGETASDSDLRAMVRNPGTPLAYLTTPNHNRVAKSYDEVIFNNHKYPDLYKAMLKAGAIKDTGRRTSLNFYKDLPIVKIVLDTPMRGFVPCDAPDRSNKELEEGKRGRKKYMQALKKAHATAPINLLPTSTNRKICAFCNREGSLEKRLLRCSRCKAVRYCDEKCQRKHWKSVHKKECKPK